MPPRCRYAPSELEQTWVRALAAAETARAKFGLDELCRLYRPVRWPADASVMNCHGQKILIEPLVGLLRNPDFPCQRRNLSAWPAPPVTREYMGEILSTRYVQFDAVALLRRRGGRAILLDIGASLWKGGGAGEGEVGAAATRWLVDKFAALGVQFDRILAPVPRCGIIRQYCVWQLIRIAAAPRQIHELHGHFEDGPVPRSPPRRPGRRSRTAARSYGSRSRWRSPPVRPSTTCPSTTSQAPLATRGPSSPSSPSPQTWLSPSSTLTTRRWS